MTERLRMRLSRWLFELIAQRSGVTAIEYGLIAAAIAVALVGVVILLGGEIANMFTTVDSEVGKVAGSS